MSNDFRWYVGECRRREWSSDLPGGSLNLHGLHVAAGARVHVSRLARAEQCHCWCIDSHVRGSRFGRAERNNLTDERRHCTDSRDRGAKLLDRSGQRHWHPDVLIPTHVDHHCADSRDCGSAHTDSHEESDII